MTDSTRRLLDPQSDRIPGPAQNTRLLDAIQSHQRHFGQRLVAQHDMSEPIAWPLVKGATNGSWRTIWVVTLPAAARRHSHHDGLSAADPDGAFCTLPHCRGVATGWPASNSLTASKAV